MIRLNSTARKLQLLNDVSGSAGFAIAAVVSFFDTDDRGLPTPGSTQLTSTIGVADTDICDAPKQNFIRNIDTMTIYNGDTTASSSAGHVVVVKIDFSGTDYTLVKQTLLPNKTLAYDHQGGWQVI